MQLALPDHFWYCPRVELTERLLRMVQVQFFDSWLIAADHGAGKTVYLEQELVPALAEDHVPVFVRLKDSTAPMRDAISALYRACLRLIPEDVPDFRFAQSEAEVLGLPHPALILRQLLELLRDSVNEYRKKRLLVVVEDMDLLGLDARHDALTYALRSFFDVNKRQVKSILTVSSPAARRRLFYDDEEPFYHFATRIDFEPLDERFVADLLRHAAETFGRAPDRNEALRLFDATGRQPGEFKAVLLRSLLLNRPLDASHTEWLAERGEVQESQWQRRWGQMEQVPRQLFLLINSGLPLFSEDVRGHLERKTGRAVSRSSLNRAVEALLRAGWIGKLGRGRYSVIDQPLYQWAKGMARMTEADTQGKTPGDTGNIGDSSD